MHWCHATITLMAWHMCSMIGFGGGLPARLDSKRRGLSPLPAEGTNSKPASQLRSASADLADKQGDMQGLYEYWTAPC